MTKLLEWLTALSVLVSLWIAVLTNKIGNNFTKQHSEFIFYLPFIAVILFGLYALTVVLYRTFTFNNCEEAAAALKKVSEHRYKKDESNRLQYILSTLPKLHEEKRNSRSKILPSENGIPISRNSFLVR